MSPFLYCLRLTYEFVKYKILWNELIIKIVETMIEIGLHVFFPYSKIFSIIFTSIVFIIQSLCNPESSVRIQLCSQISYLSSSICCTLTHLSVSNANIVWFISWLVSQDSMHILFGYYPDSSIRIQHRYCFAFFVLCIKTLPSRQNFTLLNWPNQIVKLLSSNIWWGSD